MVLDSPSDVVTAQTSDTPLLVARLRLYIAGL
jgi:hypothetical protein